LPFLEEKELKLIYIVKRGTCPEEAFGAFPICCDLKDSRLPSAGLTAIDLSLYITLCTAIEM
jgi:hypothetical protein